MTVWIGNCGHAGDPEFGYSAKVVSAIATAVARKGQHGHGTAVAQLGNYRLEWGSMFNELSYSFGSM